MLIPIKILSWIVLLPLLTANDINLSAQSTAEENYVYLCNGPSSKVYHASPSCRGLSNCSTEITKVAINTALNKGRRACRIEF